MLILLPDIFFSVQAAISYGDYLSLRKKDQISFMTENHVIIPNAAFNKEDDPTRLEKHSSSGLQSGISLSKREIFVSTKFLINL